MKPITWRKPARRDVAEAAYWYAIQGGFESGERFLSAVQAGIGHLSCHPASGSPRHSSALKIDDLRFWPVSGFPYLIFYVEREVQVDVWRVLHAQRDIPAWMGETG